MAGRVSLYSACMASLVLDQLVFLVRLCNDVTLRFIAMIAVPEKLVGFLL